MKRPRNPFPGVSRFTDRHGKVRWRFRVKSKADLYLPGAYGSAEFRVAYEAAVAGAAQPVERTNSTFGTVAWLIENYLRSAKYLNLSEIRRKTIRRELDWLRAEAGQYQAARIETRHVEAIMARKAGPTAANTVKKNMSMLFNFGIKHGLADLKHNPAKYADRRKENPDGYHTWTAEEMDQFLAHHGTGTKARLAALLIMNTGAARQDVIRLGWQNVRAGRISYRRHKSEIGGDYEILPELAEELRHVPADRMLFLTHGAGRPYKPETFGNWFKDQCKDAGLPHCSSHGLRKGQATRIAEEGGTELEVMSFLAHATPKEGATYTKKAGRGKLADRGLSRVTGVKSERVLSNLFDGLDISAPQPPEKKGKS
ncbi:tyrosine-type recombinase/integrase [Frigidibacter oleivorans]|uniref:tyrosine-type recombinase/integrase n=1 Tax=Frigidibacter oleivorans TaxID=2487129 RepID=UPI000F8D9FC6|nr:tyrosine-type recombinase/integrase [Frigidibacter oleivorans]